MTITIKDDKVDIEVERMTFETLVNEVATATTALARIYRAQCREAQMIALSKGIEVPSMGDLVTHLLREIMKDESLQGR